MKGKLICVIGIDGSGKTTLIRGLISHLKVLGNIIEYKWMKFESLPLKFIISIKNHFLVREKDSSKNYESSSIYRRYFYANAPLRIMYRYYMYFSYFLQLKLRIARPLKNNTIIICDRYIFDTMIDYSVLFGEDFNKMIIRIRTFSKIVPRPDIFFFVDIPPDVALTRKNDIPSIHFLEKKNEAYQIISSVFNPITLNGTLEKDKILKDTLEIMKRFLNIWKSSNHI